MSDLSANLSMPYIQPSQAQKHVTHNEAILMLDALVQLSVASKDQTAPPGTPINGESYILPAGVIGVWAAHDGKLAVWQDNAWAFYTPNEGWTAWVADLDQFWVFDGNDWVDTASPQDFQNIPMFGVNTTADAGNRLAVSSPATLLTHEGAGHQIKVNKNAATDTASLLFQTGWSGRAEMGTAGSDNFEIKVSNDGATFRQSLVADAATGVVSFPSGTSGLAPAEFGPSALINAAYSASRGTDLVTNRTGVLGNNYNYPSDYIFDPLTTPNLPASFSFAGYFPGLRVMTEFLVVDPNQVYRLQAYLMQESQPGNWSAFARGERHRQLMGLVTYDADKHLITSRSHMRYKHTGIDSLTTLAAPLTPGDTTVTLTDASGWNETDTLHSRRGLIIFGYRNSFGYLYDHYSRIHNADLFNLGQVNKTTNVVTLNKPLPSGMGNPSDPNGTWPAGTSLANSSDGATYKYSFFSTLIVAQTDIWYKTLNHMGGIDTSGTNVQNNFPPGTTYVKPFWLPNLSNRPGGSGGHPDTGPDHRVWFTGVSVTPERLAAQNVVTAGAASGAVEIKVPNSDFAANTVNLVPAGLSVTEV